MEVDTIPSASIRAEIVPKLNFACHQNAFAFLRDLRIENDDVEIALENVVVTLTSDPNFLKPKSWRLDKIAPDGIIAVSDRDIELSGSFLLELTEKVSGRIQISVESDGLEVGEHSLPVELLAYNEWGGAGFMPELLAAFCMPNDPAVDRVIHDASVILRQVGKNDALDGYSSGSRERVWEIASAIYTAIANLGITYAVPPASFESNGQRIRLPSQVIESRVATCLDTAMLFAAALEQVGLNPIIAMPEGHALVGVWLQPEELSTIVIDEAEILRKRVQLKELVLVETTFATNHPSPPFSKATIAANNCITPESDFSFVAAVDVKRARAHRITPLGLRAEGEASSEAASTEYEFEQAFESAPALPDFDDGVQEEEVVETPDGRLERWQRKLLDLSARNPLLNHKSTKSSLKFICPDPGLLEDKLAEGSRISIQTIPEPSSQRQDEQLHFQRTGESITEEYAREALDKRQVLVDLPPEDLSKRAVEIYRRAQTALQEGGANTLYLAIGFLLWKRDEKDDRRFRAPLILLPVTLERKSVRSGVKMLAHDDESRFNTTLLEMLRKDFDINISGLDAELPEDHSGVDVAGIWETVRKAIKEAPGFEVVEDVVLGHFSFAKYLMWKDLVDRTESLRASPIVSHLLDTPRDPYLSKVEFVDQANIDSQFKPSDLLVPLPADSSQMAAVATADRGKDFIVIGPPGTGKSQTISNLIAHLLGVGKTVLFVSEKTAALDVVYRRLEDFGIGRFCLELHSNKARKADVLSQLGRAWKPEGSKTSEDWQKEANRLLVLRDQLNSLVNRLHLRRKNGLSAHYAIGVKIRDEELASRTAFSWQSPDQHTELQLDQLRTAAENLQIQAKAVGEFADSPFDLVRHSEWSPNWESEVVNAAGKLSQRSREFRTACENLVRGLGISLKDNSLLTMSVLAELSSLLDQSHRQEVAYSLGPEAADVIAALVEVSSHLSAYSAAKSELSCEYPPTAWKNLDGTQISLAWADAENDWWPKKLFTRRAVFRQLRQGGAIGRPNPAEDSRLLTLLRDHGREIDRLAVDLKEFRQWDFYVTDPRYCEKLASLGSSLQSVVGRLADNVQSLSELKSKLRIVLSEGNDLLAPDGTIGALCREYRDAAEEFSNAADHFSGAVNGEIRESIGEQSAGLDGVIGVCEEIVDRHMELHDWCSWQRRRSEAIDLGLKPLVDAVEAGHILPDEISATFEAAYCTWWSGAVIGEDKVLREFSSVEHVAAIEQFREVDEKFRILTADYIVAKQASKLPGSDDVTRKSTWGLLRRELQKKTRHKPIRQLVNEIPDVLTSLAPCLMMSPLSVAQYLPADQDLFDVVIFDEASQITVWDAVGPLARAKQAIVAGDPKQMPPTNFFSRSDDDPDGEIDVEGDLESILDEMLGASIPQQTLNLHYRSRRESLIAFSNNRYYQDSLITFPAPIHPDNAVRLVQPDGHYSRGKARHNIGEARSIVAEIVRRLSHDDASVREMSIGVVTFNSEQQTLIENLLDDARSRDPSIEWAFSRDSVVEPVFVKNLETVQGDERDIILFSITYGPDDANHVTMNFGPLNREGW